MKKIERNLKTGSYKKSDNVDDLKNFGLLSKKSFLFWNNKKDDIYEKFYRKYFREK